MVCSRVIRERRGSHDRETVCRKNAITRDLFEQLLSCFVLILCLLFLRVLFVTSAPDKGTGQDTRISLNDYTPPTLTTSDCAFRPGGLHRARLQTAAFSVPYMNRP